MIVDDYELMRGIRSSSVVICALVTGCTWTLDDDEKISGSLGMPPPTQLQQATSRDGVSVSSEHPASFLASARLHGS